MLRPNQSQTNFFSALYDRIPEDHLLKRIANAVDFSFINDLVADSYCASFGRPAKEPELMAKLCILERLYNLSDVKVIEEANCNLAYLWFLGLNPTIRFRIRAFWQSSGRSASRISPWTRFLKRSSSSAWIKESSRGQHWR